MTAEIIPFPGSAKVVHICTTEAAAFEHYQIAFR